ncbi:hypothetical protein [Hydrogenophaga sp. 5NK40-0174]|uniref:hypothetical protein n=1 Tax=Hydrogenophaga sp. 5NK40-0174 TaxID=3127649 RepID=UPI003108C95B
MKTSFTFAGCKHWLLIGCVLLAGCVEQVFTDPAVGVAETLETYESTAFCGRLWEPVYPSIERRPDVPGRVMAGFLTFFNPGRQPIPCNRLAIVRAQGQFEFSGTIDPALRGNIATAFLEVVSFDPVFPISVTEAKQWGPAVSGGWSGETRAHCGFVVRTFNARGWRPAESGAELPWQNSTDLAIAGNSSQFQIPLSGVRPINVTSEMLASITGDTFRLRLTIEPYDRAIRSQANSSCAGRFEVRLRLLGENR